MRASHQFQRMVRQVITSLCRRACGDRIRPTDDFSAFSDDGDNRHAGILTAQPRAVAI
jgi:hypothetical protein